MASSNTGTPLREDKEDDNDHTSAQAEEELKVPLLESTSRGLPDDTGNGTAGQGTAVPSAIPHPAPAPAPPSSALPTRQPFHHQPMQELDVEDVVGFWKKQRVLMSSWLALSILSFILLVLLDPGSGLLILAKLASILSIVPPLCYLFPASSGNLDLETQTKVTVALGKLSGCLDIMTIAFFDLALFAMAAICKSSPSAGTQGDDDPPPCLEVWGLMAFFTFFIGAHAWISLHAANQAFSAQMLLNPVSSGMLHV